MTHTRRDSLTLHNLHKMFKNRSNTFSCEILDLLEKYYNRALVRTRVCEPKAI